MVPTQTFVDFLHSIGVTTPTKVISNGVNITTFAPVTGGQQQKARKACHLPANRILFLILSRLDKDKYVEDAVRALPKSADTVGLVVAGVGPEEAKLHALAESLGVSGRITWVGKVTEEQMVALYHAADGFIMMGIYEVQSIVTLQAVATGLPVIAARAGALPELCHDGENGYLVPPHDSRMVAEKMNALASSADLRKAMGTKSRQISLKHDKVKAMNTVSLWYRDVIARYKTK
jgi:glycosyltransferase involved in cell wall biosynthesis